MRQARCAPGALSRAAAPPGAVHTVRGYRAKDGQGSRWAHPTEPTCRKKHGPSRRPEGTTQGREGTRQVHERAGQGGRPRPRGPSPGGLRV